MNPVIDEVGAKRWYDDAGECHREDGPAVEYPNGDKYWVLNDMLHRLDGPAVERICGYKEWWIEGRRLCCHSNEEFLRIVKLKELL